jgi:glyoxylase-like metal-dependent hydrolase (beta-lactamase superfamily II)
MKLKEIIPLNGNTQLLDGGAMFGNAPKEMWKKWIDVDEKNRIPLSCRCLLIKNNGKNILLETGIGNFFEPKLKDRFGVVEDSHILLESLKEHHLSHEDIHSVIFSHLHFDHAGGALSSYSNDHMYLLFPNAQFYISKINWERAKNPHPRDKASFIPLLVKLLQESNRLTLIDEQNQNCMAPLINFHFSNGHTPGLMLTEILLEEGPLVFSSDLIPGLPWVHAPITMGYDRFPEMIIEEKQKLLNHLLNKQGMLFFTHDSSCAIAKVCQNESGKFYGEKII